MAYVIKAKIVEPDPFLIRIEVTLSEKTYKTLSYNEIVDAIHDGMTKLIEVPQPKGEVWDWDRAIFGNVVQIKF